MKKIFAPGCGLTIYKPHLTEKIHKLLSSSLDGVERLDICCRNNPEFKKRTQIINICAGCDKRYRENYSGSTTVSLWEILSETQLIKFPDYNGARMSIHDPCPIRTEDRVHNAVRKLLKNMNIEIIEAEKIKNKSICCGDSFWGNIPVEKVKEKMKKRARQMPENDVIVYCISCIKSMHIGGKTPRYLIDLLFREETYIGTFEPDEWHNELDSYIKSH